MASGAFPVHLLHRGGGDGQWRSVGAAYAAVTFLRPQGKSLSSCTPPGPPARSCSGASCSRTRSSPATPSRGSTAPA
ncbi:hypothetical protein ACP70R_047760 [Stipagrostis hirtigluma subsp. patula]